MSRNSVNQPMNQHFQAYKESGLCVIRENNGIPNIKWAQYMTALPGTEVDGWAGDGCGLVCGAVSDVVGLDIDTDDPVTIEKIEAISGISPVKKQGNKGFTAF